MSKLFGLQKKKKKGNNFPLVVIKFAFLFLPSFLRRHSDVINESSKNTKLFLIEGDEVNL